MGKGSEQKFLQRYTGQPAYAKMLNTNNHWRNSVFPPKYFNMKIIKFNIFA